MKNIAVITGASSGMGKKIVENLCESHARFDEIWLIARRVEPMKRLVEQYKNYKFKILALDLASKDAHVTYEEELIKERIHIKLLVNNAGLGKTGAFHKVDLDYHMNMIDVNISALTAITHISLKHMKKGSRIINMASVAGFMPQPYFNVYAASKAYVVSFSRALRVELKEKGISVLTVCPGPVDTEFLHISGPINSLKKGFFEDAHKVVQKALRDLERDKDISICGYKMKLISFLVKLLPVGIVMKFIKE
ncbi:MAG: short-chain dehydrogenase [Firmicutes bacterium HGW-Firmicutes-7]|nr:MAG: short-chain dehydrogenase [Firmicutes bacterium HGW-Firmicutes-7]